VLNINFSSISAILWREQIYYFIRFIVYHCLSFIPLATALPILRFNAYDCSFGIFKYTLEKNKVAIKNGQSRDTGNIRHTRHM